MESPKSRGEEQIEADKNSSSFCFLLSNCAFTREVEFKELPNERKEVEFGDGWKIQSGKEETGEMNGSLSTTRERDFELSCSSS